MPGSGKTTTASLLSLKLGWSSTDIDHTVEYISGKHTVSEIISLQGLSQFRKLENEAIALLVKSKKSVISTGGGAVLSEQNRNAMLHTGSLVVYLKLPLELLAKRLENELDGRPLFQNTKSLIENLEILHYERHELYSMAHVTVDVTEKCTVQIVVNKILQSIENLSND
jgi:shikimate kinase